MSLDEFYEDAELRMMEAVEALEGRLRAVRTGRPNPTLVTTLPVEAYGTESPLQQLAAVAVADGGCLVIRPFDPAVIGEIEKAIIKADLGLNPINDGKLIRLVFPPLSEERRAQQAARIRNDGEQARIAVRNIRRDANRQVDQTKKDGAPEDDRFRIKDKIQELTGEYEKNIGQLVDRKTQETMEV